jgi:hypothetical protein
LTGCRRPEEEEEEKKKPYHRLNDDVEAPQRIGIYEKKSTREDQSMVVLGLAFATELVECSWLNQDILVLIPMS